MYSCWRPIQEFNVKWDKEEKEIVSLISWEFNQATKNIDQFCFLFFFYLETQLIFSTIMHISVVCFFVVEWPEIRPPKFYCIQNSIEMKYSFPFSHHIMDMVLCLGRMQAHTHKRSSPNNFTLFRWQNAFLIISITTIERFQWPMTMRVSHIWPVYSIWSIRTCTFHWNTELKSNEIDQTLLCMLYWELFYIAMRERKKSNRKKWLCQLSMNFSLKFQMISHELF